MTGICEISNRLLTPCHTRLRRPQRGPFSYQGVSTRGVRHSPDYSKTWETGFSANLELGIIIGVALGFIRRLHATKRQLLLNHVFWRTLVFFAKPDFRKIILVTQVFFLRALSYKTWVSAESPKISIVENLWENMHFCKANSI